MTRYFLLYFCAVLKCGFPPPLLAHENVVVIPMFEEDTFIATPSDPVTPANREVRNFIQFSGIAVDGITSLAWQRGDDGVARSWMDAYRYCKNLRLANQEDWRLPTPHELFSIVSLGNSEPAVNTQIFVNTATTGDGSYWTSQHQKVKQSNESARRIHVVNLRFGRVIGALPRQKHSTKCVI